MSTAILMKPNGTGVAREEFGASQYAPVVETSATAIAEREKAAIQAMYIMAERRTRSMKQLNTAAQYLLSFQIGTLKTGDLNFMIADDAEHLGDANWEALVEAAKDFGLQLVAARVESGAPLTITNAA